MQNVPRSHGDDPTLPMSCFVSVVAPLSEDGDIIVPFLEELSRLLRDHFTHHEIVLVDAASTDDTLECAVVAMGRIDGVRLLRLSRRTRVETAILAGLESAIGDHVVVMLPDSDPPELLPGMVERAQRGAAIVSGVRDDGGARGMLHALLAPVFYWYVNRVLRLGLPRYTTEFRLLSRSVVNGVLRRKDLLCYLRLYDAYSGVAHAEMPYVPRSRRGRSRRRPLAAVIRRSVGIIVANSTHPLRVVSILGLVAGGLNVLYAGYVLIIYFVKENVAPGWATQSLQVAGMFFFLFLTLAVLSEYVIRLLLERSERPSHFVIEERQSSCMIDDDAHRNITDGDATLRGAPK
ncbi:MAG: glycosyltransferase [Planctomycetes bacterium]|nr:glycosyltransferase [Planctomycetota bacterium]